MGMTIEEALFCAQARAVAQSAERCGTSRDQVVVLGVQSGNDIPLIPTSLDALFAPDGKMADAPAEVREAVSAPVGLENFRVVLLDSEGCLGIIPMPWSA